MRLDVQVPEWLSHWPDHKEINEGNISQSVVTDDSQEQLLEQLLPGED